jgi:hypothetical protein
MNTVLMDCSNCNRPEMDNMDMNISQLWLSQFGLGLNM